jgi:hypothetical protein
VLNVAVACGKDGIVGGWANVGVAGLGDAQAVRKTKFVSKTVVRNLIFIFTSIDNYIPCHIMPLINKG